MILDKNAVWNAAGGGSAYVDAETGESVLVFHALKMAEGGMQYGWMKRLGWQDDWPVVQQGTCGAWRTSKVCGQTLDDE
ncbi:MAG: hypothetical protein M3O02_00975 [Acidobacteriota bacterium]|nr:hypothetical protein [Acidobacteriota bacterium]